MNILEVSQLRAGYGSIEVLGGLSFAVAQGEIAVMLGPNGAGKSTLLRALSGLIRSSGEIRLSGAPIQGVSTHKLARKGIAHVPQGRGTFVDLTVEENLQVGGFTIADRQAVRREIEKWFDFFPRLRERRSQQAGQLSGGEQQMLAVARALMAHPRLLLLDEPSLGLAPIVTRELLQHLAAINRDFGTTMLLVEQNANLSLDIASRGFVLEAGSIVLSGSAKELTDNPQLQTAYLGPVSKMSDA